MSTRGKTTPALTTCKLDIWNANTSHPCFQNAVGTRLQIATGMQLGSQKSKIKDLWLCQLIQLINLNISARNPSLSAHRPFVILHNTWSSSPIEKKGTWAPSSPFLIRHWKFAVGISNTNMSCRSNCMAQTDKSGGHKSNSPGHRLGWSVGRVVLWSRRHTRQIIRQFIVAANLGGEELATAEQIGVGHESCGSPLWPYGCSWRRCTFFHKDVTAQTQSAWTRNPLRCFAKRRLTLLVFQLVWIGSDLAAK